MKSVEKTQRADFTLQLFKKAARLQVLSPVKRVVFLLEEIYNDLVTTVRSQRTYLTGNGYIW